MKERINGINKIKIIKKIHDINIEKLKIESTRYLLYFLLPIIAVFNPN